MSAAPGNFCIRLFGHAITTRAQAEGNIQDRSEAPPLAPVEACPQCPGGGLSAGPGRGQGQKGYSPTHSELPEVKCCFFQIGTSALMRSTRFSMASNASLR